MTARRTQWHRHALAALALPLLVSVGLSAETTAPGSMGAPEPGAAPSTSVVTDVRPVSFRTRSARVLRIVASRRGSPYRWGATGPRAFDCSGLTWWVFHRIGKRLPRTSSMQYRATRHLRRSERRRGDLVFFHSGSHVYHVGIYAGRGRLWHAPRPGQRVHREHLWTRSVWYGRVR